MSKPMVPIAQPNRCKFCLGSGYVKQNGSLVRCPACHSKQGMGDFPASLPYEVRETGNRQDLGPLSTPIIPGDEVNDKVASLDDILAVLKALPWMNWNEYRKQMMQPGRDALWFTEVIPNQVVAAGTTNTVATITVPEAFAGAIELVGTNIDPQTSYADLNWSILVNGAVHPGFNNLQLPFDTLGDPLKFRLELTQKTVVNLLVKNTSAVDIYVSGILIGWQEALNETKEWGTSPASGIG